MVYTILNAKQLRNVQTYGYSRIHFDFHNHYNELSDMRAWLNENCYGNVYVNAAESNATASYLYFEKEQDAILYKLSRV